MVGRMGVVLLEVMEFIDDDSEEMDEIEGSSEEKLLPTTEDAEDVLPSPLIIPWKFGILLGGSFKFSCQCSLQLARIAWEIERAQEMMQSRSFNFSFYFERVASCIATKSKRVLIYL